MFRFKRGIGKTARQRRRVAAATSLGLRRVAQLIGRYTDPPNVLTAYLAQPVVGFSFRRTIAQFAQGCIPLSVIPPGLTLTQLQERAREVDRWIRGDEAEAKDPFEVLGLSRLADTRQIRRRYHAMSMRVHPDRHKGEASDYWCRRQREITEAYEAIVDPARRRRQTEERHCRMRLLLQLDRLESRLLR
jgi:hypothetical protein